jgi:hypothetical protein
MRPLTWSLLVALAILHHDVWFWHASKPLVFGFLPIGLAWHAGISVASAVVWAMAVRYCWPANLEPGGGAAGPGDRRR